MLIRVNNRAAHEVHDDVWNALMSSDQKVLEPLEPVAHKPVGKWVAEIQWPTSSTVALVLSRAVDFVKVNNKGEETIVSPPPAVVRSILEAWKTYKESSIADIMQDFYSNKGNN